MPLAGRVVLITGAGRWLGREHALACSALGAKVVVNDYGGSRDGAGLSSEPAKAVVAPGVIARARPRTNVYESNPYLRKA